MAATKVSLKLLIDSKSQRMLFAEAGKEFVDFLITFLSLPVGTVIRLLKKQGMVGCLQNFHESIESLSDTYFQPQQNKDSLLKPKPYISGGGLVPLQLPNIESSTSRKFYRCVQDFRSGNNSGSSNVGGYVKVVVTYMVMDDLVVKPMSTISRITLLNNLNVKDVEALEEKVVDLGMEEGLKLLKASRRKWAINHNSSTI
ncbi:uncharacterized protein LOC142640103 [Castanea sativa]|uniref:uncharacterized protein LOC142640103 n=1 Tax=Castanea sativa TaxID=21020 RepID=UPI003F64E705